MVLLSKLKKFFFGMSEEPEVIRAKLRAMHSQVPLLYVILLINSAFVAITHYGHVPYFLSTTVPVMIGAASLYRAWGWHRLDPDKLSLVEAKRKVASTIAMVPVLGTIFTAWSLSLIFYGGPYQQAHVAVFMALTLAACMLCLLHLRASAMQLAVIVLVPFGYIFVTRPELAYKMIAVNVVLTISAMAMVLYRQHGTFLKMVHQALELERKQDETQKLSNENYRLATRDPVTGLANRRSFLSDFTEILRLAKKSGGNVALIMFDLDGFKAVNDIYGHAAGDSLLVKAGARLKDMMGPNMFCARLSGDEFAIGLSGKFISDEAMKLAEKVQQALAQPYSISQIEVKISASAGVSVLNTSALSLQDMLEQADFALYHAKEKRQSGVVVFDDKLERKVTLLQELEHIFRSGRIEQELSLSYQSIIQASSRSIAGYEALARWQNDRLGNLNAGEFIEAAGRCGMADKFTQVLFGKLLADIPRLPGHVPISFNLSARDLVNPHAILGLVKDIQASTVAPRRLQFEVAESTVTVDFEKTLNSLNLLRNMGCSISLNNFGSSNSVLGYIYKLPIDTVKIDASFINECEDNPSARETLQAIIKLCDKLDLMSIAVGIENQTQVQIAESLGCARLQGYHIGRPKPLSQIMDEASAA